MGYKERIEREKKYLNAVNKSDYELNKMVVIACIGFITGCLFSFGLWSVYVSR